MANYREGAFQNQAATSLMVGRHTLVRNLWKFLNKPADTVPPGPLPGVRENLEQIKADQPVIVWFGHSSYWLRIRDFSILVDPVFSGNASPFSFGVKSFPGSDVYGINDFSRLDVLLLTHDHYDHLDYRTVPALAGKANRIVTSMGVGSHLEYWGISRDKITELNWGDAITLQEDISLTATPARHFSGRGFIRNKTLWSSFVLRAGHHALYLGADSGYGDHFREIGARFGPFDLAILETGQYNEAWPLIHMMPEQAVLACLELKARLLLPVHWAKFALAFHPWDEPIKRVLKEAALSGLAVATPLIGEPLILGGRPPGRRWWEQLSPGKQAGSAGSA
ncbi:MAG TPA: MBL fold metallo-hydrolase [Chitinophagaceae bacterium]|nr:MBL fold metallo-hydrolase [Chitinophagaceae bacterium]